MHPYSSIDVTAAWKKLRFILSVRSDFHRLSQNIQDIRRSHESGAGSKKKNLSRGENQERNLPGRCAITITICNSDDATESHI